MTETLYGLEARVQEVELKQQATDRRGRSLMPERPSRHRLAERLRRVADRLDA
jgi:hypothetical protein